MYGKKSMVSKTAYKIAQKIRVEQYYTDIVESDSDDFKKLLENINTTKQVTDEIKNIRRITRNTTMVTRKYRDRLTDLELTDMGRREMTSADR